MVDFEVAKLLAKAENSIMGCYNLKLRMITESYYGANNMLKNGPIDLDEYSKLLSEVVDIVIDKGRFLSALSQILSENDVFEFSDIYKTTGGLPIKINFRGGRLDSDNIVVNMFKDKVVESNDKQDELTKCDSYNDFKKNVDELIASNTQFILGILNLDSFKEFNINYNHVLGDIALIETASVMKQLLGSNGLVTRSGGDEFQFFYKVDNDYDVTYNFIRDFLLKIEDVINDIINVDKKLTATIGLSRFPLDGDNYKRIENRSRAALIRGKNKARNCFIIYLEEKCGYVDENTIFEERRNDTSSESSKINVITGVMEILNTNNTLRKRIEDSISLIGNFFYLDRIVVSEVTDKSISDLIVWYNPRSKKKEPKFNTENIKVWKSLYESSNLLVINGVEEGEATVLKDILAASNITACVAIELKHEGRLYGQIRFEMTSIDRIWQPTIISSFVLISKMISIKYDKEYLDYIHEKEMYYDSTTDVYNLLKWTLEGERFIQANDNPPYSILDIEIYEFNKILNLYGIVVVDSVLKTIANYLLRYKEGTTIFGRTSENRFTLLFRNVDELEIKDFYKELKEYVKENITLEKGNVLLKAGAFLNNDKTPLKEALDKAVIARKQESSFDDVAIFTQEMYEKEIFILKLESHIEKALDLDEFLLYLQPKFNATSKELSGAEALTRWNYNFEKLMYPDSFIPLLEKNGYISRLDYKVFENVCKLQREALDNGYKVVPISVNVSRSVKDFDKYLFDLEAIRKKYNIEASLLEIEITEGMYTENEKLIENFIKKLHSIGYKVSMDDFGSGYSNITALSQLNFDIIKFDRSFLTSPSNEKEALIVRVMTKLVKKLNMKVLFEGVETEEYEKYLTEIGCDYLQGYYYDKPIPLDTFKKKYIN